MRKKTDFLSYDRKNRLNRKLEQINQILSDQYEENDSLGVLAGVSGIALFKFYYSKYKNINTHSDIGVEMLSMAIQKINSGYQFSTYCSGISGLGWVFEHLAEIDFLDIDNDKLLAELDEYLYGVMMSDVKEGNYDFLHGAIGYGFYFLKRFKNTKKLSLKERYKTYIVELIDALITLSEKEDNMFKWRSVLDNEKGNKGYNLSLSHGISSIVNFLARVYKLDIYRDKVTMLLDGSVNYVLSFKSNRDGCLSLFPSKIEDDRDVEYYCRIAWCYGDLGIGITLWQVAEVTDNYKLKNEAISILKNAANKRSSESTKVIDAAICHGSYGNAQIFNRMYKNTGDPMFKNAALFWIEDGLEKAIHEDGYAGYKQWYGDGENWKPELSLLEGVAGIGLTIIDFLADFDTSWDECLLIS